MEQGPQKVKVAFEANFLDDKRVARAARIERRRNPHAALRDLMPEYFLCGMAPARFGLDSAGVMRCIFDRNERSSLPTTKAM